jgi:hypothetical protein
MPVLAAVAFFVSIFWWVESSIHRSDAYKIALQRVEHTPAVIHALGQPIKPGRFVSGAINMQGSGGGNANFVIPIRGPKGKGWITVKAERIDYHWVYKKLSVRIEGNTDEISIIPAQPAPPPQDDESRLLPPVTVQ